MQYYCVTIDNIDSITTCHVFTDNEEKARKLAADYYSAQDDQIIEVDGPHELDEDTVLGS